MTDFSAKIGAPHAQRQRDRVTRLRVDRHRLSRDREVDQAIESLLILVILDPSI
jgi:hypothetical protein